MGLRRPWKWVPVPVERMLDGHNGPVLEPIRAEVFGCTRFEEHGRHLGQSHRAGKAPMGLATFYPRLQNNIRTLRAAHQYILDASHEGRDITPAAEWLFDNFHLIEGQWREIRAGLPPQYYRSLPVLLDPPLVGLPRVYGVAWAFVLHTDSAFDETLLVHFLNAYQQACELSQGELWALPTTLRVVLIENLRRLADRMASHKAAQELANLCATRIHGLSLQHIQAAVAVMERRGVAPVFLLQLAQNLTGHSVLNAEASRTDVQQWLRQVLPDLGDLHKQQQITQAADHLSISNAVTALRHIGAADWAGIVTQTSLVLRTMLQSPVFEAEDEATRNTTLHGIEQLAVRGACGEVAVAQALLRAMAGAGDGLAATDLSALAGYWLQGQGLVQLEQTLGVRRGVMLRLQQSVQGSGRISWYLGASLAGTLVLVAWLVLPQPWAHFGGLSDVLRVVGLALLAWWPASEIVLAIANRLIGESVKPLHLPRFLLNGGVAASARTLVVVPVLLGSMSSLDKVVHRLHMHYLGNPESCVQFALLSDWADADMAHQDTDDALLLHARQCIEALNLQHPAAAGDSPRFLLLHRERTYSATQGKWIGWERKRGKLEQLIAALATDTLGPFFDLGLLSCKANSIRYVLTLDSDTQLLPGSLRSLVGVAEHPENQPHVDPSGRYVDRGYGILQPRIASPLPSGLPTLWQWLFAGRQGIDPYSAMASDVYQDFFDEGSFTGKGLLHVATVHAVLGGRLPTEQVLSHDLLEGALARCAVVSDITLIEADPEHSDTAAARLHRWTRGDWQLLGFFKHYRTWGLSQVNRWKLLDNLRRSLVAPASFVLVVLAAMGWGMPLSTTLGLVVAACVAAPLMGALAGWIPSRWSLVGTRFVFLAGVDLLRAMAGGVWHLVMLPQQAVLLTDAIIRTLYRQLISQRYLLEWTTAEAAQSALTTSLWATLQRHRMELAITVALLLGVGLWASDPNVLALGLFALWALAPFLVWLGNRVRPERNRPALSASDQHFLEGVARDTWRLFERVVDVSNNHLPPDNLQTYPYETVAHRTSPTNIGLYLLSVACARQFGWIGTEDLLQRLESTLETLHRMERYQGHFLNWYHTQTLEPLHPRYVSTVDSGNLSAHLLAVARACTLLALQPYEPDLGVRAVRISYGRIEPRLALLPALLRRPVHQTAWGRLLSESTPWLADVSQALAWRALLVEARGELAGMALSKNPAIVHSHPSGHDALRWLLADHLATLESVDRDWVAAAADQRIHTAQRLRGIAAALEQLAWAADYRFLYHPKRHLLHIGYRLDDHQLDTSFYDLLASESRTTSLLAIAKGDVPVRHWSALGRPFFAGGRHAVLRSWSGSMFEYLMPSLVLAEPYDSTLGEAGRSALREQTDFSSSLRLPWGISESAYAGRDHTLAYQYAPQGVPRLALRRTPGGERVIAPYATALAAQIDPHLACENFRALAELAVRGRYGYCEALDFTPERQTHGNPCTMVSTYMAHHQGMTIVALANVLMHGVAQQWGMGNPRIEAMSSLLHERPPRELPMLLSELSRRPSRTWQHRTPDPVRLVLPGLQPLESTHLLTNGRYSVTLRANGAGWSRWCGMGVTRWRDDALRDDLGSFVYVRRAAGSSAVSVTSHPAPDHQATYQSHFHTDRVCFDTAFTGLRVQTTVWVSPEDDIELRRVVLSNQGDEVMEVEIISALDITLVSPAADEAHPAFSNLFIKADWLPAQQALRFVRTPRLQAETTLQAAHFVADVEGEFLSLGYQTDRQKWLGRHHTPSQPLAWLQPVPEQASVLDTGLDPVAALSVWLRIAPGAQACVTFATAASDQPGTLLAMIDKYRQPTYVERSSVMSSTLASIQSASHRLHRDYLPTLQLLTTALVFTLPKRDAPLPDRAGNTMGVCDRRVLWPLAISGDRPLILVMAGAPQGMGLLRILSQALREWSYGAVSCDLVVLSSEVRSYYMPLQLELAHLREQHDAELRTQPGPAVTGLHVWRLDELLPDQLSTLRSLACIQLQADGQSLIHQVRAWRERYAMAGTQSWRGILIDEIPTQQRQTPVPAPVGIFTPSTGAFCFDVGAHLCPLRPWINVLANPHLGGQVSDSGAGNTWALNSRLNQLTAWSNDPVADPPAEWFLLQDRRTREVWSLTPSAWGASQAVYRVVHEQGRTTISHRRAALEVSVSWCVDPDTAIKQIRIRVDNQGRQRAHLRITGMVEWMMGEKRSDRATLETAPCFVTPPYQGILALLCTQKEAGIGLGGLGEGTAFFCEANAGQVANDRSNDGLGWTCDRSEFFDTYGQLALPVHLGQRSGYGLDPCAALSRMVTLRPGAALEQVYLIGYADSPGAARQLALDSLVLTATQREAASIAQWNGLLGATQVRTPDPLFDVLVNRWLLYQTVSSRLWAKSGFYQAGGATGYRDQLQDAMALAWVQPNTLRSQIVLCASRQFEAGDVQHWWHAPGGAGVRTHFSDDLLWLPYACTHYLQATADKALLDEPVLFLQGATIPPGAEDIYETPTASATSASVYEHAARAIDRSLQVGVHGLPLIGGGDWNDGMNRVGDQGLGESVWLAWFLCAIVADWIPIAQCRADTLRAETWRGALDGWLKALDTQAWDGEWFQRAFFDNASALGSAACAEARIDLIAQAWAVLSGCASDDRQRMALDAVEAHLVNHEAGLIALLAPPLVHAQPSAGYIQAYPPGVRENGGQYAHAGVWALMAAAALAAKDPLSKPGAKDTPYRYFTYLSPAHRAQHPVWGFRYAVEPYVMAADVYTHPPFVGRGGWSWYTGAAGWMHRAAVESILGLQLRAHTLCFNPCLPSHWPQAEITLVRDGRTMRFLLVRAASEAALAVLVPAGAQRLQIGELLYWEGLPAQSCFVVPLDLAG